MSALLAFAGVGKSHWRGARPIPVLRDVSFALGPGDFAAVLGDRRMGKTTLLRIAAGVERPDEGEVTVAGRSLSGLSDGGRAELWQRDVGCVWSGAQWPARTMLDTVCVPLLGRGMTRRQARRRASQELARWEVGDAAGAMPHELSDAELLRVGFAEALVRRPRVLLADDPTETLNLIERNRVLAHLQRIARDERLAVLISATDASGAAGVNRLLVLVGNGELREAQTIEPAPVIPLPTRRQASAGDA